MGSLRKKINKTLDGLKSQIEAHDGFVELGSITESTAVIHYGDSCADCDSKCIEDELNEKFPYITFIHN